MYMVCIWYVCVIVGVIFGVILDVILDVILVCMSLCVIFDIIFCLFLCHIWNVSLICVIFDVIFDVTFVSYFSLFFFFFLFFSSFFSLFLLFSLFFPFHSPHPRQLVTTPTLFQSEITLLFNVALDRMALSDATLEVKEKTVQLIGVIVAGGANVIGGKAKEAMPLLIEKVRGTLWGNIGYYGDIMGIMVLY